MNSFSYRQPIRVFAAILITGFCIASPVAAVEGFLVLYSFGWYVPWLWLPALLSGFLLGVAYQVIVAYNRTRSPNDLN